MFTKRIHIMLVPTGSGKVVGARSQDRWNLWNMTATMGPGGLHNGKCLFDEEEIATLRLLYGEDFTFALYKNKIPNTKLSRIEKWLMSVNDVFLALHTLAQEIVSHGKVQVS